MKNKALRHHLRGKARAAVQARDLKLINAAAHWLNSEAADVLEYQAPTGGTSPELDRALKMALDLD